MIEFEQALTRLLGEVKPLMPERVPVAQADGRVLCEPLYAPEDIPRYDYSAMDGYALASGVLQGPGPWQLPVSGLSQTGHAPPWLDPDKACRLFTGAPLPAGADTVVQQEHVERQGDTISFSRRPAVGEHVRFKGEDLKAGVLALETGTRLGPAHLALAASLDVSHLWVRRRPVMAVVSTGDELRYPGEPARVASLPESVSVSLAALAKRAGAQVRIAPFARDNPEHTVEVLGQAMLGADLVVTVGGVSVGDYDVVRPALATLGIELDFWKVRIKPGKPLAVGKTPFGRYLGLPGNPTSAQVTFMLFAMPLLRALQGDAQPRAEPWRRR